MIVFDAKRRKLLITWKLYRNIFSDNIGAINQITDRASLSPYAIGESQRRSHLAPVVWRCNAP